MTTAPGFGSGPLSVNSEHVLAVDPPYRRPALALGVAAIAFAITAMLSWPGLRPPFAGVPGWFAVLLDAALLLAPLLVGALIAARLGGPAIARALGIRFAWIDLVLGALVALVARAISEVLVPTEGSLLSPFGDNGPEQTAALVVSIIVLVLLAPLVEELFFRGAVQRALTSLVGGGLPRGVGAGLAITLSTIAFMLLHAIPYGAAVPFSVVLTPLLVGVGAGVLVAVTRRIGGAVTAHVLFNVAGVILLLV